MRSKHLALAFILVTTPLCLAAHGDGAIDATQIIEWPTRTPASGIDCFSLVNSCEIPFYTWSIPNHGNTLTMAGEAFTFEATGLSECTLKTVYVVIYDWQDTAVATHTYARVQIHADDGAGLPGAILADEYIDPATIDANLGGYTAVDFSSYNLSPPAGGELHIIIRSFITPGTPSVVGDGTGFSLLSDAGSDDSRACLEGAANRTSEVFYESVGSWERVSDHFGGFTIGFFIAIDVCCGPPTFSICTPGSDLDWATQGNGYGRTNATSASISNLCGLTTSWSAEPGGDIQATQPIIADGKVIVTATDSVHCYDAETGAQIWAVGGFPYIIGDLRGSPTVEGGLVFFGGSGAQAFTCVDLAFGNVIWSRNLGGGGDFPLLPGQTNWTPSVVSGGIVYFTQETGNVYALDFLTGADVAGSPLALPDAPGATPVNGLTSDGTNLYVGTADAVGTAGNIHQIDMATLTINWSLSNPGIIFYPGNPGPYDPEGFPGTMAYEDGILYYHSQIRCDGCGFLSHFSQTGSVGAIDVATEDGAGTGILWVNDATSTRLASPGLTPSGSYNFSGPAVGPGMIYLTSRGYRGGTTEQDGVSAWHKTLGTHIWYDGYKNIGVSNGFDVLDDARSDVPATVFCGLDGTPYLFTGHVGGDWRLYDGNSGELQWQRTMSGRVRGTAVTDDLVATVVRNGGPATGGGSIVVFSIGADRPRLQIDSQFVFRTATSGDGAIADNLSDAIRNTGCVDLTVSSYTSTNPAAVRISSVHPALAAATRRSTGILNGYSAMLDGYSAKSLAIQVAGGVDQDVEDIDLVRTFANAVGSTADPLFLTVDEAPGVIGAGATQSLAVTYDETVLANNASYTNYIEIASDDPDYYPQDPSGASYGDPIITFELLIGCPDAAAGMTLGLGEDWVTNYGALADGVGNGIHINGNDYSFDGGTCLALGDGSWAIEGFATSSAPSEWGPALPCGVSISATTYDRPDQSGPLAGFDAVEEATNNMIDLGSLQGFFTPGDRQCGGLFLTTQRVGSQDPAFGDFSVARTTIENEANGSGTINDIYYGSAMDWDVPPFSANNTNVYSFGNATDNGGGAGRGASSAAAGMARLDADAVGTVSVGSGGSPNFGPPYFWDDNDAFLMMSDPANYIAMYHPGDPGSTDVANFLSMIHIASLAEGESESVVWAAFAIDNGVNGLPWTTDAEFDAAIAEIVCRARAFAGHGKGDVNCDGHISLQDVVALGNILDGLLTASGGAIYTQDVNGDGTVDEADYQLLYDVVSGVQPESNLANAWRFQ